MAATARARSPFPTSRAACPIHQGNGFILAETGGAEEITLTVQQIPAHTHPLLAAGVNGDQVSGGGCTCPLTR